MGGPGGVVVEGFFFVDKSRLFNLILGGFADLSGLTPCLFAVVLAASLRCSFSRCLVGRDLCVAVFLRGQMVKGA